MKINYTDKLKVILYSDKSFQSHTLIHSDTKQELLLSWLLCRCFFLYAGFLDRSFGYFLLAKDAFTRRLGLQTLKYRGSSTISLNPRRAQLEPVIVCHLSAFFFVLQLFGPLAFGPFFIQFLLCPCFPYDTCRCGERKLKAELC